MRHPDFDALEEERTYRLGDMELPQDVNASLYQARRFLLREPERSRRAIRLLFANWLAQAEGPGGRDRKPAVFAIFRGNETTDRVPLYPVGPEVPGDARTLPPHEMATWLVTAYDLKLLAWQLISTSVPSTEQSRISRAGGCPGDGALSSRARGAPALGGSPGRDLSPEPARRRIGRPG